MSGQTTTNTTFVGDATPTSATTTALPTGGPLRWLAVPSGEWSPCDTFTLQWQGGIDPYALQPIVTYGNGSSVLGVTRTNLVTDHYEYLGETNQSLIQDTLLIASMSCSRIRSENGGHVPADR